MLLISHLKIKSNIYFSDLSITYNLNDEAMLGNLNSSNLSMASVKRLSSSIVPYASYMSSRMDIMEITLVINRLL